MRLRLALLALCALCAAGGGPGGRRARTGRFSTRGGQERCGWELRGAARGGELRLSCRPARGGAERSCAYLGPPRRCPAHGARSPQYWRRVLSRLRRRPHPCGPGAPLSARLCGPRRAPPEEQPRLLPDPAETTAGPADTYCAQRWHSLCSFFVGFWEG